MGNRSKRRRRETDEADPAAEWQEEARWSGYTRHIRWPFIAGGRGRSAVGGRSMPTGAEWLGIAIVVAAVLGGVLLLFWLLSLVLP